jgi:hypothetical protein
MEWSATPGPGAYIDSRDSCHAYRAPVRRPASELVARRRFLQHSYDSRHHIAQARTAPHTRVRQARRHKLIHVHWCLWKLIGVRESCQAVTATSTAILTCSGKAS